MSGIGLLADFSIADYEKSIELVARPAACLQENLLAALKALKNGYGQNA